MPGAPARVVAEGWGWRHAGRRAWACSGIDLVIEPGERVLLLGASGAGKSTFMGALAGVLGGADEGEEAGRILVDGRPPAQQRGRIGLVMQDPDAQVVMSRCGDDVAFGLENLAVEPEQIWPRVVAALAEVGLDVDLAHATNALSGGQRQRLVLAGVVAMSPGLLLLDEPTANIDPDGAVAVRDAVARVVADRSTTLVVVEHRTEQWADLVDRVVVLSAGGGVMADGPVDVVFREHRDELAAAGVWVPGLPTPEPLVPADLAPAVLSAEHLAVGWSGAVVRRLTVLELERGRSICLTGPNGCGKTTLALTLAGLLPAVAGHVVAAPALVPPGARPDPGTWRSRDLLTRIGTVFQNPEHQFVATTVADELLVGLTALRIDGPTAQVRVDELLERLRLARLAKAHPMSLSGGEKRRLSVATVLATAPEVIFLDEPTFGQDRVTWTELVGLVRELRDEGRTIVSVTHDEDFVACLGERHVALPARREVEA